MHRPISDRFAFTGLSFLILFSLITPLGAQEKEEESQALEQAEPAPFLRVTEVKGKSISLEIASRDFVPREGTGPTVTLMGVAHIGERSFYRLLQKELATNDLVLYESVLPPGAKGAGGESSEERIASTKAAMGFVGSLIETYQVVQDTYPESLATLVEFASAEDPRLGQWLGNAMIDAWDRQLAYRFDGDRMDYTLVSLGSDGLPGGADENGDIDLLDLDPPQPMEFGGGEDNIQAQLASALRLQFQLHALNYDQPNWRCSDMAMDQVDRALAERGVDFQLIGGALGGTSMFARMAKVFLGLIRFADTLLDGAIADMIKVMLIEMLGNDAAMEMSLDQFGEGFSEVIVDLRNQVVIDDLKTIVEHEENLQTIAILYGAAHMKDMAERICAQLDYEPAEDRWYQAIEVDLEKSAVNERDLRQMRMMMQQMMRMQSVKPKR
ncbi:MAG: type II secretion system protein GspG [Planctomycetota bacterium]|nr:type II secretion system protein GspG [Planctomycetota bacterium]